MPDTLIDLFNLVYEPRKLIGCNPNTALKFRIAINHYARYIGHNPTLADLDDDLIGSFLRWLVKDGLSPHTANTYGAKLAALWDYLGRKRISTERPSIKPLRAPRKKPVGWSEEELRSVLKACGEVPGRICKIPARLWWLAIHAVIIETGERIQAILLLKWENFDERSEVLTRPAEIRKWKTEDMASKLSPVTVALLKMIREFNPDGETIFPTDFDRATIWNRYRGILKKSGLPHDRYHLFHCLRRTSGSIVKRNGGDAQQHLGHREASTTAAYMVPEIIGDQFDTGQLIAPFEILNIARKAG